MDITFIYSYSKYESILFRIHAVRIVEFYSKQYLHDHCNEVLDHYGINDVRSEDVLNVLDDYLGPGYDKSTDKDLGWFKSLFESVFCCK